MNKNDSICFSLKRMTHIVERGIHCSLAACGFDELTNMHGRILGFIYSSDKPVYQRDIEKHFSIGRSSVTNILQLMEKKGYITRVQDKNDARLKHITLTDLGVSVHLHTIEAIDNTHERMEAGITPEERRVYFSVIDKIRKNTEKITGREEK